MRVVGASPLNPKEMGVPSSVLPPQRAGQAAWLPARVVGAFPLNPKEMEVPPPVLPQQRHPLLPARGRAGLVVEVLGLGNWDPRPTDCDLFRLRTLRS